MRAARIDVHQHLWPEPFLAALRERSKAPCLDGWTLLLDYEPEYAVVPDEHDPDRRGALNRADRLDLALISLSGPLGIEHLPAAEAAPLLDAYHRGVLALPDGFGAWAAACVTDPDPDELGRWLDAGCVGLQLPATALAGQAGYARCEPLLRTLEERGKPLFVHPGPAAAAATGHDVPAWWAANVDYVQQMHAAYYAFAAFGRPRHPALRVCFALLCGLAPLHWERADARGGPGVGDERGRDGDRGMWFETSSYGASAIAAMGAAVGTERIVLGSDRPYAAPADLADEAAEATAGRAAVALLGLSIGNQGSVSV